MKRFVIAQHELGVYLEDRSIKKILRPGTHKVFDPFGRVRIEIKDISIAEFSHPLQKTLAKTRPALVEEFLHHVELNDYQVGLIFMDGNLRRIVPPGSSKMYWKESADYKIEILDITNDFGVPGYAARLLGNPNSGTSFAGSLDYVYLADIPDNHAGMLIIDGQYKETLKPGRYVYWKFNRSISVESIDLRIQAMEVQGQEILSKDKVSLRVNLSAQYQMKDPLLARNGLSDINGYVYRELQFALRKAVGSETLDSLLSNKSQLDDAIFDLVKVKTKEFGIEVHSVGVKDVILPSDMKDILNHVVEAEKTAQANVIKRREETAATRSLLNTAKLMDDNPTLLRLKELEVLEKVSEKINTLTVFGGMDGILKDTIKINVDGQSKQH